MTEYNENPHIVNYYFQNNNAGVLAESILVESGVKLFPHLIEYHFRMHDQNYTITYGNYSSTSHDRHRYPFSLEPKNVKESDPQYFCLEVIITIFCGEYEAYQKPVVEREDEYLFLSFTNRGYRNKFKAPLHIAPLVEISGGGIEENWASFSQTLIRKFPKLEGLDEWDELLLQAKKFPFPAHFELSDTTIALFWGKDVSKRSWVVFEMQEELFIWGIRGKQCGSSEYGLDNEFWLSVAKQYTITLRGMLYFDFQDLEETEIIPHRGEIESALGYFNQYPTSFPKPDIWLTYQEEEGSLFELYWFKWNFHYFKDGSFSLHEEKGNDLQATVFDRKPLKSNIELIYLFLFSEFLES